MPGYRARRRPTRAATRTGPEPDGRCAPSRRSWPTRGTRAGRCGTGSGPTSTSSTRPTPPSGTGRCSGGTCPKAGSSQNSRRMRRWSARRTSSRPRTLPRRADRQARRCAGTCWPGCSSAVGAGGGWNQRGPTAGPPTGAATVTPAPPCLIPSGRRTSTCARTTILPHLAALSILLADGGTPGRGRRAGITAPARTADLIDQLRATGTVLTYDPGTRTIRAGDGAAVAVTAGQRS